MPQTTINTKFFTFRQNNSGGSFDHYPASGIGYAVAVEALNAMDAVSRAESIGLYFNGCETGQDCSCCGDRWSDWMTDDDGTELPSDGYGNDPIKGGWGIPAYIHYIDGHIEAVPYVKE